MIQIYRRASVSQCYFSKIAYEICGNDTTTQSFSCKLYKLQKLLTKTRMGDGLWNFVCTLFYKNPVYKNIYTEICRILSTSQEHPESQTLWI